MGAPGNLIREETLIWAGASERTHNTHPPKALGGNCSLLQFRGWHLLFWHGFLSVVWFFFLSPKYVSLLAKLMSWVEGNPLLKLSV